MSARKTNLKNVLAPWRFAEKIEATQDAAEAVASFREGVALLAELPREQRRDLCRALAKKTGREWESFYAEISERQQTLVASDDSRAVIKVGNEQLADISAAIIAELQRLNSREPELFRYGGGLVEIRANEQGRAAIHSHDVISLRGFIVRRMRFIAYNKAGEPVNVKPPREVIEDILKNSGDAFPVLDALTATPIMHADGCVYAVRGYDAETRLYFAPEPDFKLAPIQDLPTRADAVAGAQLIAGTIFKDFSYATEADFANAFAALVTGHLRAVEGFTEFRLPLFVIDAPKSSSGKTLCASAVTASVTGHSPAMVNLTDSEPEIRKSITALIIEGAPVVILDDATGTIRSKAICTLATAPIWKDRILTESRMFSGKNNAVWFITGTNLGFTSEVARRVVRIRIDPKMANPQDRTDIAEERRGPDKFFSWIMAHRGEICGAVLTLIKAWILAGRPSAGGRVIGSFEMWSKVVGDILAFGGVEGFLGNVQEIRRESDEESAEWLPVLEWAARLFDDSSPQGRNRSRPFTAGELAERLNTDERKLADVLPELGFDRRDGGDGDAASNWSKYRKRFGHAVKKKVGTRYGEFELRFERAGEHSHTGKPLYTVAGDLEALRKNIADRRQATPGEEEV